MAKMIVVESCEECPYRQAGQEHTWQCTKRNPRASGPERSGVMTKGVIPDWCPLGADVPVGCLPDLDGTLPRIALQALAWAHADACIDMDNGLDPRQKEIPALIDRFTLSLRGSPDVPADLPPGINHTALLGAINFLLADARKRAEAG